MSKRLYEVEVTFKLFVVADDSGAAEKWAESNITEWSSDPARDVFAIQVNSLDMIPSEDRSALPWVADGISNAEMDKPLSWWVEKRG